MKGEKTLAEVMIGNLYADTFSDKKLRFVFCVYDGNQIYMQAQSDDVKRIKMCSCTKINRLSVSPISTDCVSQYVSTFCQ